LGRRLGQHFLFQQDLLERIAAAACGERAGRVIEIGPGPGGLTGSLRPRCDELILVELDPVLAAGLRARYAGDSGVRVVEGDVLSTDLGQWGPAVVCGNLPYYITSPIVERALGLGPLLRKAVFLVQREVAERLAAGPGTRDYGFLSASVQVQCRVERLFVVKPNAFRPPPKVDSAVVRLTPLAEPLAPDPDAFRRFVSACFRQKRKTLRNNLAHAVPKNALDALPEAGLRAEQLGVAQLAALLERLTAAGAFSSKPTPPERPPKA
jgi:16S rRNA (adenine1518-N6/adenine1519-N6)-dimethyltransferase